MKLRRGLWIPVVIFLGTAMAISSAKPVDDVVLDALQQELQRSMEKLRLEELAKPYFISYKVDEHESLSVSATFGGLESSNRSRMRLLTAEVRVGDYAFDNTNFRGMTMRQPGLLRSFGGMTSLPLDDDPREIRRTAWLATDGAYKQALEQYSMKRAALQNKTLAEEIPDFSREDPAQITETREKAAIDEDMAEDLVRKLSSVFRRLPVVDHSEVHLNVTNQFTRYINSEGSWYVRGTPLVQLTVTASCQADDGMLIVDQVVAMGPHLPPLPSATQLEDQILAMGRRMAALREAPVADRYNGPVLLESAAAAELFAQGFAPHLLASREPVVDDEPYGMGTQQGGVAFEDRIGARVLPRFLKLVDDPTIESNDGQVLVGSYMVDDQGVPARRTAVIERGILKTLLTDRTPVAGVEHSTGNARGQGILPSNLVLIADDGMSPAELMQELLLEITDRELDYGILVRRIGDPRLAQASGGMRGMPGMPGQNILLIEAFRVYPDGREELIRNAEAVGLSPRAFKDIIAAGTDATAHSTQLLTRTRAGRFASGPISLVVPSLLFEDLTLNRPTGEIPTPPITSHPFFEEEGEGVQRK
jgi:TldD protein